MTITDLKAFKADLCAEIAASANGLSLQIATAKDEMRNEMRAGLTEMRTEMRTELGETRTEMRTELAAFRSEVASFKDEIIRHFDIVAENLRRDFDGAHRDQIQILKDHDSEHVRRIRHLEQNAGLIV